MLSLDAMAFIKLSFYDDLRDFLPKPEPKLTFLDLCPWSLTAQAMLRYPNSIWCLTPRAYALRFHAGHSGCPYLACPPCKLCYEVCADLNSPHA